MKTINIWSVFLVILALAALIISCFCYFGTVPMPKDGASMAVAVLGILVTVLIGWHIINAIETQSMLMHFRELDEKMQKRIEEYTISTDRKIEELFARADEAKKLSESFFLYDLTINEFLLKDIYFRCCQTIHHFLLANVSSNYGCIDTIVRLADNTLEKIEAESNLTKEDFANLHLEHEYIYHGIMNRIDSKTEFADLKAKIEKLRERRMHICEQYLDQKLKGGGFKVDPLRPFDAY